MSESSTSSNSPMRPNQALPSLAAKRKAACEFIRASTGMAPPYATDQAFRAALKDGVLLCKLANTVWPGIVQQVGVMSVAGSPASPSVCSCVFVGPAGV